MIIKTPERRSHVENFMKTEIVIDKPYYFISYEKMSCRFAEKYPHSLVHNYFTQYGGVEHLIYSIFILDKLFSF